MSKTRLMATISRHRWTSLSIKSSVSVWAPGTTAWFALRTAAVADEAREERIRDLRILARRETGKELVVSIMVAFGLAEDFDGERRRDIKIEDRR